MSLPGKLTLTPINNISGTVDLPGSKSISNRILLLSMLAEGNTEIHNLLDSDDTRRMMEALNTLRVDLLEDRNQNRVSISGTSGTIPVNKATLMLGNAGTVIRPMTAALTMEKDDFA
jgi:5-enolpyruvylshikimate-3-phosphate synthase